MVSQSFSDFRDEEEDLATLFDFDFRTKSDSELLLSDPTLEWLVEPNPNNNPYPMSDYLFDHQKESILIDKKMEKVSLLDSNPSTDKEEEHQYVQEEINTAAAGNGGESKEADVVSNDVAIEGNTTTNNQSTEKEESEDSSSEEDDDSSSSSSDSDSSSSSSEDDEDEDESSSSSNDKELDEEVEEGEIKGGDDEFIFGSDGEEVVVPKGPIKSKHEIEDYPPVPPITASLEPHHQTLPVGVVSSIMGSKVIVEGCENHNALNEGSILWITETRLPLGIVDEIFGPVKNPYYIVRYNSESEVPEGVKSGITVSFVADFADHIINYKSLYQKGYDASGADDEEVDLDLEFSDDEKEAEYRRSLRQNKRDKNHKEGSNSSVSNKKKYVNKGDGRIGKFNAPQPTFSNTGDGVKGTSSTSFPPQHSNGSPNLGMPPQQFTNSPSQGLPPRPHNIGMPGGGYPTVPNWMPNQQENQNFGMMQFQQQQQQQQQHQILTNALLGLIGQASLSAMPFGSGPLNPAFNQGGFGQVPFGSMNPNPGGQVPFGPMNPNPSGQVPFGSINPNPGGQVPFVPMNPNPSGQVPFGSMNPNPSGQVPFGTTNPNPGGQVPFGPMNPNPSGLVPFGSMYPNPSKQVPFGPTNPNPNGQVPFGPMNPNGPVVNQNQFGQVPPGSVSNQGEMGGTGSMQLNSERSFSSGGSINNDNSSSRGRGRSFSSGGSINNNNRGRGRSFSSGGSINNNNNRGRGRSFGRGRGHNAFGSRGGSKHSSG